MTTEYLAEWTNVPQRVLQRCMQGDVVGPFYLEFPDPIASYTFSGAIRKEPDSATVAGTVTCSVYSTYVLEWSVLPSVTAALTCHPTDDDDESSRYYLDLQVTPGDADLKYTAVRMELRLTAEVDKT